jgi:dihydroorotate dehydrogenase (NAD+) catalytic subunit
MPASGVAGYGEEYAQIADINKLGAIVTKTITVKPKRGNPPPRIWECPSAIVNSVGLENVGIEKFLSDKLPRLLKFKPPVIVSIGGSSPDEFALLAKTLDSVGIQAVELNLSCPNIGSSHLIAQDAQETAKISRATRKKTKLPIIAKLSPDVTDIEAIAKAAVRAGVDILAIANTYFSFVPDNDGKPVFSRGYAGLSGPAIRPLTLRLVRQVHNALPDVPIIGIGGIMSVRDALDYFDCGARAIAIGTGILVDPLIPFKIIDGLKTN